MSAHPNLLDLANENVIVGNTYLVRTIRPMGFTDVPVMGDAHEDVHILGVKQYHFHFDLRFMSDEMALALWERLIIPRHPEFRQYRFRLKLLMISALTVPKARRKAGMYKPWKCLRTMPIFPRWMYVNYTERIEAHVRRFNLKLRADRRGCLRCPHRGMPLAGLWSTENDIITCPAHGTSWNVATGDLVQGYIRRERPSRTCRADEGVMSSSD